MPSRSNDVGISAQFTGQSVNVNADNGDVDS